MDMTPQPISYLPPASHLSSLKNMQDETGRLVLIEVAGRDSVAAFLSYTEKHPGAIIVPTIATTGTEYGSFAAPVEAIAFMQKAAPNVVILDPVYLFSPNLWRALNGRFTTALSRRYPGWSPCAACHFYLHLMRAPLAFALGSIPIVTGERDTHDGRYKLSQTPEGIQATIATFADFGIDFIEPIQHMHEGKEIEALVGSEWDEGARQLECVFSGSFKDEFGQFSYDRTLWDRYLGEFAVPVMREVLEIMREVVETCALPQDEHFEQIDWVALVSELLRS